MISLAGFPFTVSASSKSVFPFSVADIVKGNPAREMVQLICADVDFLVQLRQYVMQDVVEFFHSFSINKISDLESLREPAEKEKHMLLWAETDSLETAVKRRVYILANLPKIPAAEKGKAPLLERDPIKGNHVKEQFSLILADIKVLVQLREQIIDDVDKFFNSFSLKNLANLKIDESYFDKEALILSWAETDSTRVALNRRMYILTKYRELLIRKFLEARMINFVPGEGSSATDLKVLEMLSDLHMFVVEELKEQTMAHGLRWEKTCCSKIFEGRPRDRAFVQYSSFSGLSIDDIRSFVSTIAFERTVFRDVQIAQSSVSAIHSVQSSFASADSPYVQLLLDQRPLSPSTKADSSMHFVEDDIQLEDDSAPDQFILTSSATAISASIAALWESFSTLVANQSKDSRTNNAINEVMYKIDHVQRVFLDSLAEQNETFRGLFKRSRQEAQNDNNALSLALKAVRTQNVILSTDLEATRKEVKDIKAALSKDFDDKLADIRNELLDFRVDVGDPDPPPGEAAEEQRTKAERRSIREIEFIIQHT
ncbi:hypothetical protein F511_19325 [Dorcoceras hygrometricum]|uniref:Uncharacterized protein n=1 Tax=Dorcoceras hygrometricum TaxID=472368 RepID=A0A2Z7BR26_9LAMI|nr:hypothetical protein F511_19325 [Dorcoceras hygrometricum]